MAKPRYRPLCEQRACLNKEKAEVSAATQYVRVGDQTLHVCGGCANRLAIEHGIGPDPKLRLVRGKQALDTRQLRIEWP